MAFHSLMIKIVAETLEHLPPGPRVVELGNQTFKPQGDILERVAAFLRSSGRSFDEQEISKLTAGAGEISGSTGAYYLSMGFASYDAIDLNERYGSIVMGLNRDIKAPSFEM